MNQVPKIQDSANVLPQSVVYAYPPSYNAGSDVNLKEMVINLAGEWKLMAKVAAGGCFLSLMVTLFQSSIYQVNVELSVPTEADVSVFTTNGLYDGSPEDVFKRYYNQVRSTKKFSEYLVDNDYLSKLFPSSGASQGRILGDFVDNFSVDVIEPQPIQKGGLVSEPERISIKLEHTDEALAAELLSTYVKSISASLIKSIQEEQKILINGQIKKLEAKIDVMRIREKKKRLLQISRLKEENTEKINDLTQKIETSINKAKADTQNKLVQINESRVIAQSLGITNPVEIKNGRLQRSGYSEIQGGESKNGSIPLFMMGTRYLDSLSKSLKNREDELAFVDGLSAMRQEIALLNNDVTLTALETRESDDPYIPDLPNIQVNIAELKALSLDFSKANTYVLDKAVLATEVPIKPNRALIFSLGVVFSGIIAFMAGAISMSFFKKQTQSS